MHNQLGTQLLVQAPNETGIGADIFSALSGLGISVISFVGWIQDGQAFFAVVVDQQVEAARQALATAGFSVQTHTVVLAELASQPGALVALLRTLAEANIDVKYAFATSSGLPRTLVILHTSNNEIAKHVISTIPSRA